MLERLICIDNVGVLKKGVQKAVALKKLTLIYADNARGKSTLSSMLLACADRDVQELRSRKTVGATTEQKVVMRFVPPGAVAFNVEFSSGHWVGPKPNLHVFNQDFVERNVFASGEVLPNQREALLDLALGEAAVAERATLERQGVEQRNCAERVRLAEAALSGHRGDLSINQFMDLEPLDDVDTQLEALDKEITEARTSSTIAERPGFLQVTVPVFDLSSVENVLVGSFTTLAVKAEEVAKAHFAKHNGPETERWAAEGMHHKPHDECPFCGQGTAQVGLLRAYREYFDGAYTQHLEQVANLHRDILRQLRKEDVDAWDATHERNLSVRQLWSESLPLTEITGLSTEAAEEALKRAITTLSTLADAKVRSPHSTVDITILQAAKEELAALTETAQKYNQRIDALNDKVAEYKRKAIRADGLTLEAKRKALVIQRDRFDTPVVALVTEVKDARAAYKNAVNAKDAARKALDKLMADTLAKFQSSINEWLTKFGAPFQIDGLAPTYAGGDVRSEYVLKVRGATVIVGPRGGGDMSFNAALSEGDKRTLAFAFFLAMLFADANRASAAVVLDDVFTSLDKDRRRRTVDAIVQMLDECAQVIALGHDAHFLREVKMLATKKKLADAAELVLQRDAEDCSYVDGSFDLNDYCRSEYYKHYLLVERYVAAEPGCDKLEVAKALRLLVEGHLHRCFPKWFGEGQTVGAMLDIVKNASPPNPLVRLKPLHADLSHFNDFAAAFHHDTAGGYPRQEVTDGELLSYARGALGFIQVRSFYPDSKQGMA